MRECLMRLRKHAPPEINRYIFDSCSRPYLLGQWHV
jgi:hypothetical protein